VISRTRPTRSASSQRDCSPEGLRSGRRRRGNARRVLDGRAIAAHRLAGRADVVAMSSAITAARSGKPCHRTPRSPGISGGRSRPEQALDQVQLERIQLATTSVGQSR
jgi:hypothetical protein